MWKIVSLGICLSACASGLMAQGQSASTPTLLSVAGNAKAGMRPAIEVGQLQSVADGGGFLSVSGMPYRKGVVAPAPLQQDSATPQENLQTFDPFRANLQWNNNSWRLVAGNVVLKDFGRNEKEGQEALRLIQELHLTQRGTVGSPKPVMEYWLSNGQPPHKPLSGGRGVKLDPGSLRVEQINGQWYVRDNFKLLFNFKANAHEAALALSIIQRYGFTEVNFVGQTPPNGRPSMLLFTTDSLAAPATPPRVLVTPYRPALESSVSMLVPTAQKPASPPATGFASPQAGAMSSPHQPFQPATGSSGPGDISAFKATQPPWVQPVSLNGNIFAGASDGKPGNLLSPQSACPPESKPDPRLRMGIWERENSNFVPVGMAPGMQPAVPQKAVPTSASANQRHLGDAGAGLPVNRINPFGSAQSSPTNGGRMAGPSPLLPSLMDMTDRTPLDWTKVQVCKDGDDWKLVQGAHVLANFGAKETDALKALEVVRFYRFTEQCRIGYPKPTFSCFLVKGQAPKGVMPGLDSVEFQPGALVLRQLGQDWVIGDGRHILFRFGDNAEEARQALRLIQQYKFDRICRADRGSPPAMTVLVRGR